MKKVLSTIVAALVAVSFAGIVCAAEAKKEAAPATSAPAAGEVKKEEKAPKKEKKGKKTKKAKKEKKTDEKPADAPAAK